MWLKRSALRNLPNRRTPSLPALGGRKVRAFIRRLLRRPPYASEKAMIITREPAAKCPHARHETHIVLRRQPLRQVSQRDFAFCLKFGKQVVRPSPNPVRVTNSVLCPRMVAATSAPLRHPPKGCTTAKYRSVKLQHYGSFQKPRRQAGAGEGGWTELGPFMPASGPVGSINRIYIPAGILNDSVRSNHVLVLASGSEKTSTVRHTVG
ncbi:hypothetical protein QE368_001094 [Asaia bogorensis NBRC 16594]|nr:hypothetical protein [Asaia bogorensis NBRC 16594]